MPRQPKTYSLETATVEAIERLAAKTRRNPGAIIDLAVELYDQVMGNAPQTPAEIQVINGQQCS